MREIPIITTVIPGAQDPDRVKEVRELQKWAQTAKMVLAEVTEERTYWHEAYAKSEAENNELREYATHKIDCDSNITFGKNCTCGLNKVLEE